MSPPVSYTYYIHLTVCFCLTNMVTFVIFVYLHRICIKLINVKYSKVKFMRHCNAKEKEKKIWKTHI